jgi:hypothetical protein
MLLAGFIFLYLMATIRSVLGSAESPVRGSAQLARVAFAGALTGMAGMTMAFVTLAAASSEGADANPVVSRAVTTASRSEHVQPDLAIKDDSAAEPEPRDAVQALAFRHGEVPDAHPLSGRHCSYIVTNSSTPSGAFPPMGLRPLSASARVRRRAAPAPAFVTRRPPHCSL